MGPITHIGSNNIWFYLSQANIGHKHLSIDGMSKPNTSQMKRVNLSYINYQMLIIILTPMYTLWLTKVQNTYSKYSSQLQDTLPPLHCSVCEVFDYLESSILSNPQYQWGNTSPSICASHLHSTSDTESKKNFYHCSREEYSLSLTIH